MADSTNYKFLFRFYFYCLGVYNMNAMYNLKKLGGFSKDYVLSEHCMACFLDSLLNPMTAQIVA